MSPRSSKGRVGVDQARPDVYVGLLAVACAALLFGILFLVLELGKYNWTAAGG